MVAFMNATRHFLRSSHPALYYRAALLGAQAETADRRFSITKDVPSLRIDHFSIEGKLLGMWQAFHRSGVRDIRNETLTRA
jgi:hypothetical protein